MVPPLSPLEGDAGGKGAGTFHRSGRPFHPLPPSRPVAYKRGAGTVRGHQSSTSVHPTNSPHIPRVQPSLPAPPPLLVAAYQHTNLQFQRPLNYPPSNHQHDPHSDQRRRCRPILVLLAPPSAPCGGPAAWQPKGGRRAAHSGHLVGRQRLFKGGGTKCHTFGQCPALRRAPRDDRTDGRGCGEDSFFSSPPPLPSANRIMPRHVVLLFSSTTKTFLLHGTHTLNGNEEEMGMCRLDKSANANVEAQAGHRQNAIDAGKCHRCRQNAIETGKCHRCRQNAIDAGKCHRCRMSSSLNISSFQQLLEPVFIPSISSSSPTSSASTSFSPPSFSVLAHECM